MANVNLGTLTVSGYSLTPDPDASFSLTITAAVTDVVDPPDPVDPPEPPEPEEDLVGKFVAPTGNNSTGDGTVEKPFKTVQKAYSVANAGDTIYLRGGKYKPNVGEHLAGRHGTEAKPIRITNHPGEIAEFDGSVFNDFGGDEDGYPTANAARGSFFNLYRLNHVHMDATMVGDRLGIRVTRAPTYGISILGGGNQSGTTKGVWIRGVEVDHVGWGSQWEGKGIFGNGYLNDTVIENCDCHDNQDKNSDNADGVQWMAIGAENKGNVIRGNRFAWNSDDGIDMFNTQPNTTAAPTLVEKNLAYGNGYQADDHSQPAGDGMGFKLGGGKNGSKSGGHTVRNNAAWKNRTHGFDENAVQIPLNVFNNTSSRNVSKNWGFWSDHARCVLKNNISHAPGGSDGIDCADSFNSWNLPVTVTDADFVSLDDSVAIGPRQADGSLPDTTFLTLASNSDLRNKGTDVGIPFTGSAPDLGWKETA